MVRFSFLTSLVLALTWPGCLTYEYEHEIWLRVDGSGSVYVTGRPGLWESFKSLPTSDDKASLRAAARELFERSGLRVRRVLVTRRAGRSYLFVSADFADVNKLSGTPAFPDLEIRMTGTPGRLRLDGVWRRPAQLPVPKDPDREGLLAVRFHLPSKVYSHDNATDGVERGNIVAWREKVTDAVAGSPLRFGAIMDSRSILWSTVGLFATSIGLAILLLAALVLLTARKGRKAATAS